MYKKTALITGASGFVGQHFIDAFSSEYNIIAVSQEKILQNNVENIQIDFSNINNFFDLILKKKPDYIFNFKACFENNFDIAFSVNTQLPQKILECIQKHRLPTRVVLIGSAAEYGLTGLETATTEKTPLNPISIYGVTKAMQSLLSSTYHHLGVDVIYARLFNLYGPNIKTTLLPGLLHHKIQDLLSGKISQISLKPLSDTYDFMPIQEAVKNIKQLAELGNSGEIYNIASGTPCLVRDFVKQQLQQQHLDFNTVINEELEKPEHIRKTIYACTKKFRFLQESIA